MNFLSIRRYHKLKSIIRVRKLGDPEENSVKKPKEKSLFFFFLGEVFKKTEKQPAGRAKTTIYFLRLYNLAQRLSKCLILKMLIYTLQKRLWFKKSVKTCVYTLSQQFSTEGRADSDDLGNVFKLQNTQILQDYSGNGLERSKNIAGKKIPHYCGLYFLGRKPVLYFASQEIY